MSEPNNNEEDKKPFTLMPPGWLLKTQKYSALIFSAFFGLHSLAVVVSPAVLGVETAGSVYQLANGIYQTPVLEPIILGAVGMHVAAGVGVRWWRGQIGCRPNPLALAGWALVPLVGAHFTIFRALPAKILGDSSLVTFEYVTHVLRRGGAGQWLLAIPLVLLSAYHVFVGLKRYFPRLTTTFSKKATNLAVVGFTMLGVTSMVRIALQSEAVGWVAKQYRLVI
jgi:hypothetical protein